MPRESISGKLKISNGVLAAILIEAIKTIDLHAIEHGEVSYSEAYSQLSGINDIYLSEGGQFLVTIPANCTWLTEYLVMQAGEGKRSIAERAHGDQKKKYLKISPKTAIDIIESIMPSLLEPSAIRRKRTGLTLTVLSEVEMSPSKPKSTEFLSESSNLSPGIPAPPVGVNVDVGAKIWNTLHTLKGISITKNPVASCLNATVDVYTEGDHEGSYSYSLFNLSSDSKRELDAALRPLGLVQSATESNVFRIFVSSIEDLMAVVQKYNKAQAQVLGSDSGVSSDEEPTRNKDNFQETGTAVVTSVRKKTKRKVLPNANVVTSVAADGSVIGERFIRKKSKRKIDDVKKDPFAHVRPQKKGVAVVTPIVADGSASEEAKRKEEKLKLSAKRERKQDPDKDPYARLQGVLKDLEDRLLSPYEEWHKAGTFISIFCCIVARKTPSHIKEMQSIFKRCDTSRWSRDSYNSMIKDHARNVLNCLEHAVDNKNSYRTEEMVKFYQTQKEAISNALSSVEPTRGESLAAAHSLNRD
jgi:dsDNA-binding SOS-regulon protein